MPNNPPPIRVFLPKRSESIPQKGEKKNWVMAKEAPKSPIVALLAWNVLAYTGSRGKIIEKATILMNTAK